MEDPVEEWAIEEYPVSGEEVSQSKVSWILSRGLWLGKKVVITGVMISSAPLVLPPLVVVSALGFAVSVPFGVVLASYTCTEKLLNKLLPLPQPSGLLDYGPVDVDKAGEDGDDKGEFSLEEEEKKQIQDTKENVEMRIELVEDSNKEEQEENKMPIIDVNSHENSGKVQEEIYSDVASKEKGYEEDDGEYLEGDDVGSSGGTNVKIEGQDDDDDDAEESMMKTSEDAKSEPVMKRVVVVVDEEKKNFNYVKRKPKVVMVARPVQGGTESAVTRSGEVEVFKAESTGLLEKIRDIEDSSAQPAKKNKKKTKQRLKKALGLGGKKEDESIKDNKGGEENLGIGNVNKDAAGIGIADARKADETSPDEDNGNIEVTAEFKCETVKDTVLDDGENGQKAEMPGGSSSRGKSVPHPVVAAKQANQEIDIRNAVVSNGRKDGSVESNVWGTVVPSKEKVATASLEIFPRQLKNLREQIDALRLIVGYKAAPLPSFTEELKALYVFTGVELPSSFQDPTDMADVESKLRFLKSIIGVI